MKEVETVDSKLLTVMQMVDIPSPHCPSLSLSLTVSLPISLSVSLLID
jgi:hypothetical protein